jgi:lysophospholipase L1-like esterase
MNNYRKMVDKLSRETPNSRLYLQSVLPINNKIRNHRRTNEEIKALNAEIEMLAKDYGATYIDLFSLFINDQGLLRENLTTDGIHINGNGYQVWRNAIYDYVVDNNGLLVLQ